MAKTQPQPVRDPASDNLLAPENCVIALIDFQDTQFSSVTSSSRERENSICSKKFHKICGICSNR